LARNSNLTNLILDRPLENSLVAMVCVFSVHNILEQENPSFKIANIVYIEKLYWLTLFGHTLTAAEQPLDHFGVGLFNRSQASFPMTLGPLTAAIFST
jgi:hypothetical protein